MWETALKSDLDYSVNTVITLKGISFAAKKNKNIVSLYVGGALTEAINAGSSIGTLGESLAIAGYMEFVVYDIKNHVAYSMTIDSDRSVKVYGQNLPSGAQLRGATMYFAPNT